MGAEALFRRRLRQLVHEKYGSLDRFYLDALWLVGRYPLWWLIPVGLSPERYAEHANRLQQQRFVAPDETFDFGPVPTVAPEEWLEASVVLLERASTDPLGALRELQLIEARTSRGAAATPGLLAEVFKAEVHRNQKVDSAELATGALTRREVERYLGRNEAERSRLDYAKRLHSDGFGIETNWSLARRIEEEKLLLQELDRALRAASALRERATKHVLNVESRLQLVHDLLVPARADADHISSLHAALLGGASTNVVSVDRYDERWRIRESHTTLFASPRLVPIAVWLHQHGVGVGRLEVEDVAARARLERLLAVLHAHRGTSSTLLLVNAEREPMEQRLAPDEALVSEWDDPLDYSGYHHNLVVSVDRVELAGGAVCKGNDGQAGIVRAFEHALASDAEDVALHCIGAVQSRAIESRIRELTAELRAAFHGDSAAGRFVFPSGQGFTIVTRTSTGIAFASPSDENALVALLRAPLPARRPVTLPDSRSRRLLWLRRLAELIEIGRPTLLIVEDATDKKTPLMLFLSDHDGSIHRFVVPGSDPEQLAGELTAFFSRQRLSSAAMPKLFSSSVLGLTELRVSPDATVTRVALRVRREPGRVDVFHGERRWSNVAINDALLDELLAGLGPRGKTGALVAAVGEVAFEAETPRLPELLALKLGFERRLMERTRLA